MINLQIACKDRALNEKIDVVVTLRTVGTDEPVNDATVEGELVWLSELPASEERTAPADLPSFAFDHDDIEGLYKRSFNAPAQPGYYELRTTIAVPLEPIVTLQSQVVVKKAPNEN